MHLPSELAETLGNVLDWVPTKQELDDPELLLVHAVLSDALTELGWTYDSERGLSPPALGDAMERKQVAQTILTARVEEQFFGDEASDQRFTKTRSQLLDSSELLRPLSISEHPDDVLALFTDLAVCPVKTSAEKATFRYLRHAWRIPFNTTPGRTLSFIVRVGGTTGPIIGIFSLASPAMWMSHRDEALGFENFDLDLNLPPDQRKRDWLQRWSKAGLVDDGTRLHPHSGRFTVSELLGGMEFALIRRLEQFPLEVMCNDNTPAGDARRASLALFSDDINMEGTTPVRWEDEPTDSTAARKRKAKRRRIVDGCLDALSALRHWRDSLHGPMTLEAFYAELHDASEVESGPARVKALKSAMREAKTQRISADLAEMIICGAIPPFNALRVGKLVAMVALSNEVADDWHNAYNNMESVIASQLAGRSIRKSANLSSLSTTGLYGRSNAQYDRIRLRVAADLSIRLNMVGVTGTDGSGPSNLMLSGTSWGLVRQVVLAKDIEGVSGKFGEGTSARLRRMQAAFGCCEARWPGIRKILARVVENPFSRSVHVAHLAHNSIRFNLGIDDQLHVREGGRSLEEILEEWKDRWLRPLLTREAAEGSLGAIERVRQVDLNSVLPPFEHGVFERPRPGGDRHGP